MYIPGTAICSHYEQCGGCSLQHLSFEDYRAVKVERLKHALAGAGLSTVVLPMLSAPQASRRRTTLVARKTKTGTLELGYHPAQSHEVTDIATCPILVEPLQQFIPTLRLLLTSIDFKQADIALVHTGEGIDLQWLGKLTNSQKALLVKQAREIAPILRIVYDKDDAAEVLFTRVQPSVSIAGVRVYLPARTFLQASEAGEKLLQQAVIGLCQGQQVADLFSGLGTFSLALAQAGKEVTAVDSAVDSLKALRAAAEGLPLRVMERDLFKQPFIKDELNRFHTVVLDPPRAGAKAQCTALAESHVRQVVYVSCNPQTLAQDAVVLLTGGYKLHSVLPVDQFLWSNHLEVVADFRRS